MFQISGKMQVALLAAILTVLAIVFLVTHTVKHAAVQSVSAGTKSITIGTAPAHGTIRLPQLVAAVCDMTTYLAVRGRASDDPDLLPQSAFEAMCSARTTQESLFLGRYTSYADLEHDLTHVSDFYRKMAAALNENVPAGAGEGTYVAIRMADGSMVLFESGDNTSTAALAPLQAYGFTISPVPPQA